MIKNTLGALPKHWKTSGSRSLTKGPLLLNLGDVFFLPDLSICPKQYIFTKTQTPYHPWDWYIYLHENHKKNQPFIIHGSVNMQIVPWMVWELKTGIISVEKKTSRNWDRATENISPHHHSGSPPEFDFPIRKKHVMKEMRSAKIVNQFELHTLQGINISHLGKRKIIFKMPFLGDMLVPWRVKWTQVFFLMCIVSPTLLFHVISWEKTDSNVSFYVIPCHPTSMPFYVYSGDGWMYPYQHTPMGNPYISRMVRGIYGWKNPQESQTITPAITTMGPQGNHRQQLVAERSQLPRRDKPLGGFLGEEVQHFPTRPWYVRHINLVPFETYQKGQLNLIDWFWLHSACPYQNKNYLNKKTTKTANTLFFSTISNIFWRRKICKKLSQELSGWHIKFLHSRRNTCSGRSVWFWKKHISPKI